jgi:putative peptidoglycan lipid II flippase
MTVAQGVVLRRDLRGVEAGQTLGAALRMLAAAALLGAVSYGVWSGLDASLGRSLVAQVASVGGAIVTGFAVYAGAVWALRIPEARQIRDLLPARLGGTSTEG